MIYYLICTEILHFFGVNLHFCIPMNDRRNPVDVPGMDDCSDCGSNSQLAKKIRWIQKHVGTPTYCKVARSHNLSDTRRAIESPSRKWSILISQTHFTSSYTILIIHLISVIIILPVQVKVFPKLSNFILELIISYTSKLLDKL